MGCASSAPAPQAADTDAADAKGVATRQRRKLSLAPGHVGDISLDANAGGVEVDTTSYKLTEVEITAKGQMNHAIKSQKGFVPHSKKKVNQDRPVLKYAIGDNPNISMFGVMDGHGEFGHLVSTFVQTNLPRYLALEAGLADDPPAAITEAVRKMCEELKDSNINCSFSGTTCVFGVKVESKLYVANIGDSRCVMAQKKPDGSIVALDLSFDHKPESPGEKERIMAAGGRVETLPGPPDEDCGPFRVWLADVDVPGLAMSRSIGDEISQTVGVTSIPEITTHECVGEDMFCVFASDGVWEFIESQSAIDLVWKHKDNLEQAATELVNQSTIEWKKEEEVIDDITCTIIQFNSFD